MKLDAIVNVRMPRQNILVPNVTVPIDADYVEANELDIREFILNSKEIDRICKQNSVALADLELDVTNINDLIDDLKFDEFRAATNADFPMWN